MNEAKAIEAQALAERVAAAMWARDVASQALGMRIVRVAPGRAALSMPVRADMLNGHAICHGGFIFTLCDSTFAYACNSYNLNTVASGCAIDFLAPAREDDLLTAVAHERSAAGRTGVYDIEVANQRGEMIAVFRGKSYRIRGHVVDAATSVVPSPDYPTRGQAPAGTQRLSSNDTGFPPPTTPSGAGSARE